VNKEVLMSSNSHVFGAIILGILATGTAQAQEPASPGGATQKSHIMLAAEDPKWEPCPPALPPGALCAVVEGNPKVPNALFALRAKMPDNYRIAPHFHPADEHVVILKGSFNMGLGDKFDATATRALTAGSFAVMPKGTRHFAWTKGETILHVYAVGPWDLIYVNPEDDPRKASTAARD
jgi:quercetin dioxygenase-like cupin family protein